MMTNEEKTARLVKALGNVSDRFVSESAPRVKRASPGFEGESAGKTLSVISADIPERRKKSSLLWLAAAVPAAISLIFGASALISTLGVGVRTGSDAGGITITLPKTELPVIEEKSAEELRLEYLRREYPRCFGLGTFKGLELYAKKTPEGEWLCGIAMGTDRSKSTDEIAALDYLSLADMKLILGTYEPIEAWFLTQVDENGEEVYFMAESDREALFDGLGLGFEYPPDPPDDTTGPPPETEPAVAETAESAERSASEWGIAIKAENAGAEGFDVRINQSGVSLSGELCGFEAYGLERADGGKWEKLALLMADGFCDYTLTEGGEHISHFGGIDLKPGRYRLELLFELIHKPGDIEYARAYTEFEVTGAELAAVETAPAASETAPAVAETAPAALFEAPPETEPVTKTFSFGEPQRITNDEANPGSGTRVTDGIVFNGKVYSRELDDFAAGLAFDGLIGRLYAEHDGFEGYSRYFDGLEDMLVKLRALCGEDGNFDPAALEAGDAPEKIAYYGGIYDNDLIPLKRSRVYYLNESWLLRLNTDDTSALDGTLLLLYKQDRLTEIRRVTELLWALYPEFTQSPAFTVRVFDNDAPGDETLFMPEGLYLSIAAESGELEAVKRYLSENGVDIENIEFKEVSASTAPDTDIFEHLPVRAAKTFDIQHIVYNDMFPAAGGFGSYFFPISESEWYPALASINGTVYTCGTADAQKYLREDAGIMEMYPGAEDYFGENGELLRDKLDGLPVYAVCELFGTEDIGGTNGLTGFMISDETALLYLPSTDMGHTVRLCAKNSFLTSVRRATEFLWGCYSEDIPLDAVAVTDGRGGGCQNYLEIIADEDVLADIEAGMKAAGIDTSVCRFVTREEELSGLIPVTTILLDDSGKETGLIDTSYSRYTLVFDDGYYGVEFPFDMNASKMAERVSEKVGEAASKLLREAFDSEFAGCERVEPYSDEYDVIKLQEKTDISGTLAYYRITDEVIVRKFTSDSSKPEYLLYIRNDGSPLESDRIRKVVTQLRRDPIKYSSDSEDKQVYFEIRGIEVLKTSESLRDKATLRIIADERYHKAIADWVSKYLGFDKERLCFSAEPADISELEYQTN